MKAFFYRLFQHFFPYPCIGCGRVSSEYYGICKKCYNSFSFASSCIYCGERDCGGDCIKVHSYDYIFSLYDYSPIAHRLLIEIKFRGHLGLFSVVKRLIEDYFYYHTDVYNFLKDVDIISFVPIGAKRLKERGFNQAEYIAFILGKILGKEVVGIFRKVLDTEHQSHLSRKERLLNLRGSIEVMDKYLESDFDKIVVVDDVFTTGATLSTIGEVCKRYGVSKEFIGFTLFRA